MPRKLIIDCDPGVGDAVALAVALCDPSLEVVGITATAGAVSGEMAARNIQAIIETLDPRRWPRVGVSTAPAVALPPAESGSSSGTVMKNGPAGLGDLEIQVADLHNPRDSVRLMTDLVRESPNDITLLTLGPLTNVELACERMPSFAEQLLGLVCCCGSVAVGGDVTAAAEFNVWADPEAAAVVLRVPAARTMIPLDVSREPKLTYEAVSQISSAARSGPLAELLPRLLSWQLRVAHEQLGIEGAHIPELAALAFVAECAGSTTTGMSVEVETSGNLTRGATVFDRRNVARAQTGIDVVDALDPQCIVNYLMRIASLAGS